MTTWMLWHVRIHFTYIYATHTHTNKYHPKKVTGLAILIGVTLISICDL